VILTKEEIKKKDVIENKLSNRRKSEEEDGEI
jgi:hypothetical protein